MMYQALKFNGFNWHRVSPSYYAFLVSFTRQNATKKHILS